MPGSSFVSIGLAAAWSVLTVSATLATAQAPTESTWIAWNSRLESVRGKLVTLGSDGARLRDDRGRDIEIPASDLLAIMQVSQSAGQLVVAPMGVSGSESRPAIVELTDGQRWPCYVLTTGGSDDLLVEVPNVGKTSLQLDVLRRVVFDRRVRRADVVPSSEDRVVLANGDIVNGTLLNISSTVEIETGGSVTRIPSGSAAAIELVNPSISPAPMRLWLNGGAVFATRSLDSDSATGLRCDLIAPDANGWHDVGVLRPWDQSANWSLEAVEFAPAQLVPWASLEVASFAPEGDRRWTPPPEEEQEPHLMDLSQVELPGPMRVTWRLPRGAQRACGQVSLTDHASVWADCVVRVEQQGRVLWEQRLNADQPERSFVVELAGAREISLRVLPGEFGPIDDRVRLNLGWVLLDQPDESG